MTEAKEKQNEIIIRDMKGNQIGKWDSEMAKTMKNTVAKGATDTELQLFAQVCDETGLNPYLKEIWFVKYGENEPTITTGRDGFLKVANMDPLFMGVQGFAVYENDLFDVTVDQGKVVNVAHKFSHVNRGVLIGAWAVAEKEGKNKVYAWVELSEFIQYKKDGQPNRFWKQKPATMIKKVAEADVLKRICGITGVQVAEAMPEEYSSDYIDADFSVKEPEKPSEPKQVEQPRQEEMKDLMPETDELAEKSYAEVKKAMKATSMKLNIDNVEKKAKFLAKNNNYPQFNDEMIPRVMKVAEKELGVVSEHAEPIDAEFTKKEPKQQEKTTENDNSIDMVAGGELDRIERILNTKNLELTLENFEAECDLSIQDPQTTFDKNMKNRVLDLAKTSFNF